MEQDLTKKAEPAANLTQQEETLQTPKQDITGQRWGRLVAIRFAGYRTKVCGSKQQQQAVWLWQCDCGNTKLIPATQVKHGTTRSCGCMSRQQAANLRTEDITGEVFGRLTAVRPTQQRDAKGSILWELSCACGNTVLKTVNELKSGRVQSCGCWYKESRKDSPKYRKDFVENTSISNIVVSKRARATNSSGHTGVWFNPKTRLYEAYISFQKKRYFLGAHKDLNDAVRARKEAEHRLHDPVILEYFQNLTPERQKEFLKYLKDSGIPVEMPEK